MNAHYTKMTTEHLGCDATEKDLREFQLICEAAEELHPDIENITDAVWGDGDYYTNASKLGVDLDAIEKELENQ